MQLIQLHQILKELESVFEINNVENVNVNDQLVQFDLIQPKAHGKIQIKTDNTNDTIEYYGVLLPQIGTAIEIQNEQIDQVIKNLSQTLTNRVKMQINKPYAWQNLINLSNPELDHLIEVLSNKQTKTAQNYMTDIQFVQAQNYNLGVLKQLIKFWQPNNPKQNDTHVIVKKINQGLNKYQNVCENSDTPLSDIYKHTQLIQTKFDGNPITINSKIGINENGINGAYSYVKQIQTSNQSLFDFKNLQKLDESNLNPANKDDQLNRDYFKTWVKNLMDLIMTIKKTLTNWYRNHQIKIASNKVALLNYYRKGVLRLI